MEDEDALSHNVYWEESLDGLSEEVITQAQLGRLSGRNGSFAQACNRKHFYTAKSKVLPRQSTDFLSYSSIDGCVHFRRCFVALHARCFRLTGVHCRGRFLCAHVRFTVLSVLFARK